MSNISTQFFRYYINYKIFSLSYHSSIHKSSRRSSRSDSDKPHKIWRERDVTWCINTWYDITHLAYMTLSFLNTAD